MIGFYGKVSIIIINYNTFCITVNCINSIIEKTKLIDYEIVLVDNASSECDPEIFKYIFPEIILVKSTENIGFAKGNNLGLKMASHEYILLLNSDTIFTDNALLIACERIAKDEHIGALSVKLIFPDGVIQHVGETFPSLKKEVREFLRINKLLNKQQKINYYLGNQFAHLEEKQVDWIWGAFFLTKRKILNEFPGKKLHDDFFMYAEDLQWCYFMKRLGYKILYYPGATVIHHLTASSSKLSETEKYRTKILPNIFQWMKGEKGRTYTYLYYIIKILHWVSLMSKESVDSASFHLRFLKSKLIKFF